MTTAIERNEAAVMLREWLRALAAIGSQINGPAELDEALAAERRNTVERIRDALHGLVFTNGVTVPASNVFAILDAEAKR